MRLHAVLGICLATLAIAVFSLPNTAHEEDLWEEKAILAAAKLKSGDEDNAEHLMQATVGSAVEVTLSEAERWLNAHNAERCKHGVPDAKWSDAMAASAQQWANKGEFKHADSYSLAPPEGPAGENIAMGYPTLESTVEGWYKEVANCGPFPGCKDGATGTTGHFTAMVWKGVKEIGCGINAAKRLYVCRYKGDDVKNSNTPNMGGAYTSQVFAVDTSAQCSSINSGSTTTPTAAPTGSKTDTSGTPKATQDSPAAPGSQCSCLWTAAALGAVLLLQMQVRH